jgi:hypothetical protein
MSELACAFGFTLIYSDVLTARNLLFGVDVYGQENVRFEERWKRGKKKRTVPTEH